MVSPTIDQGESAQIRVEERGKQRAETKESSNSELLALLKEMKEEMRERVIRSTVGVRESTKFVS